MKQKFQVSLEVTMHHEYYFLLTTATDTIAGMTTLPEGGEEEGRLGEMRGIP